MNILILTLLITLLFDFIILMVSTEPDPYDIDLTL